MIWDIILGSLAAVLLILVLSFAVTGLANLYQKLFERYWQDRIQRHDLIPIFARFAAVATIILLLVLSLHMGSEG
jgi:hypothetical protein